MTAVLKSPAASKSKKTRGTFKSFSIRSNRKGNGNKLPAFKQDKSPKKKLLKLDGPVGKPYKKDVAAPMESHKEDEQNTATEAPSAGERTSWKRFSELAVTESCRGNFKEAATHFTRATRYLSVILEAKKEEDQLQTVDSLEAAKVYEQYAQTLNEMGKFNQAMNMAKRAVELAPQWPEAHQTLYRAQLNWGEPLKALQTAKDALLHIQKECQEIRHETANIEEICNTMREDETPRKGGPESKFEPKGRKRGRPMWSQGQADSSPAKQARTELPEGASHAAASGTTDGINTTKNQSITKPTPTAPSTDSKPKADTAKSDIVKKDSL